MCTTWQDTGIGISAQQLSTLFKSFSQSVSHFIIARGIGSSRHASQSALLQGARGHLDRALTALCVFVACFPLCFNLCCVARLFAIVLRVQHISGEYGGTGQRQRDTRRGGAVFVFVLLLDRMHLHSLYCCLFCFFYYLQVWAW